MTPRAKALSTSQQSGGCDLELLAAERLRPPHYACSESLPQWSIEGGRWLGMLRGRGGWILQDPHMPVE